MKRRQPPPADPPLIVRPAPPADPLTLSPAELAALLGIKPDTLRKWRKIGRGPAFVSETPRSTVYLRATVEHWLRTNQQTATD